MNYKIIKKNTITDLEKEVDKKMEEGYIPTGGILKESGNITNWWYQAIYKV